MRNKHFLCGALACAFAFSTVLTGGIHNENTLVGIAAEEDDPYRVDLDFSTIEAVDQNGAEFTAEAFADKDVTIINLWGTFCSPCIKELPDLASFSEKLPDNVQLITLCVDGALAPDDAKAILEKTGFEGISLITGNDAFQNICNQLLAVPMTVFVDKDGHMIGDGKPMDDIFEEGTETGNANAGTILGGGMDNLDEVYLKAVNRALNAIEKEEIQLESESEI